MTEKEPEKKPIIKIWPQTMYRAGAAEFVTRPEHAVHARQKRKKPRK